MPTSGARPNSPIDGLEVLLARFTEGFQARFGYPPGTNAVVRPDPAEAAADTRDLAAAGVPAALVNLYREVAEIRAPDVGHGYFVHTAPDVLAGLAGAQPTRLAGAPAEGIVVFGSDGGGGLFALGTSGGAVHHLTGGSWLGDAYDAGSAATVIAPDVPGFLSWLSAALAAEAS